jgi:hypothetical protein
MADDSRRDFLKRLGIGSAVVAGSLGFVVATTPKTHRGQTLNPNNNVVVGNSNKVETLYKPTKYWSQFYESQI